MPHKHKRRQNDPSAYDLPPSLIAKPLPVRDASKPGKQKSTRKDGTSTTTNATTKKPQTNSRRKSTLEDDTPRAFRRLMQFQQKPQPQAQTSTTPKSGNKKRKRDVDSTTTNAEELTSSTPKHKQPTTTPKSTETDDPAPSTAIPKILPGEKLSDFAARVDREMPISEMKRSNKPASSDIPKIREQRQTKHEKHLRRLQRQWREDDVRIREREAAEREERAAEMDEQLQLWKEWEVEAGTGKAKKKGTVVGKRKRKGKDGVDGDAPEYDDGPDPWAKLKKMRASVNPFDVVQEPPQLKKPKEVFKVRGGAKVDVANVPAAVGSLRRREELANERRNIVEEYRRLMAEKRQ